jgi:hypothetical protein
MIDPPEVREAGARDLEARKARIAAEVNAMTDQELRVALFGPAAFAVNVLASPEQQIEAVIRHNTMQAALKSRSPILPRTQSQGVHLSSNDEPGDGP